MTLSIGLPLTAGLALILYCLLRRERWQQQAALRRMQWAFGFAVLALALSLHAFPWDGVQNWLGRAAGKMAGMFQYPWRFLSLATVLLCLASVLAVQLLKEKNAAWPRVQRRLWWLAPCHCRCGTDADHIGHGGTVLQCVPEQRPQCFHPAWAST